MGTYIDIGNAGFLSARNSEYVDKSELISVVNQTLNTENRFSCVSRCRRFGKSVAAILLELKYNQSADSALSQIKRKEYQGKVAQYSGHAILVGINYDRTTKQHECHIERYCQFD